MKYITTILILAFLAPLASAQYTENAQSDFENFPSQVFTFETYAGNTTIINFRGFNYDIKQSPDTLDMVNPIYMIVSSTPGDEIVANSVVMNCSGIGIPLHVVEIGYPNLLNAYQPTLTRIPYYWTSADNFYVDTLFVIDPGSNDQLTISQTEEDAISWSAACSIKSNQDLTISFMVIQDITPFEVELYAIPNEALEELIYHVNNTFQSAYSLLQIFLMVAAVVLFIFIPVYIWKLIEYMYRSYKNIR